jgi:hypothetical protein
MTKAAELFKQHISEKLLINKTQCTDWSFYALIMAKEFKKLGALNGLTIEQAAEIIESEIKLAIDMQILTKSELTYTWNGSDLLYLTNKETGKRINYDSHMPAHLASVKYRELLKVDVAVVKDITLLDIPIFYLATKKIV